MNQSDFDAHVASCVREVLEYCALNQVAPDDSYEPFERIEMPEAMDLTQARQFIPVDLMAIADDEVKGDIASGDFRGSVMQAAISATTQAFRLLVRERSNEAYLFNSLNAA